MAHWDFFEDGGRLVPVMDGKVRVRGNALEIQSGKRWLDYTHTALSAQ